jgi:hypothetical protein
MPRRPSIAILIIVAGAFFLIGLYTAFLGGDSQPGGSPSPTPGLEMPTAPVEGQEQTVLILGADQLAAETPQLRAVWFVTSSPPLPDLFVLGVSPTRLVEGDPPASLADHFRLDSSGGPTQDFLDVLYRVIPLDLDAVAVLDHTAFATAIDFVGGVTINDATFTGQEVLGILSLSRDDPESDMLLQRRLLEAMAAGADLVGDSAEITALVQLQPDHLYLSLDLPQMVGLVAPLLPIQPATTHIEIY